MGQYYIFLHFSIDNGLYADNITITTRHKQQKKERTMRSADMSEEIIKQLDLKKMSFKDLAHKDKSKI